jgi:hypothetical protein
MLKTMLTAIALAFLAMMAPQNGVMAQYADDEVEEESGNSVDEGPDCDWVARQVRNVGTAYWKTRYYNQCVSTVEREDDPDADDH